MNKKVVYVGLDLDDTQFHVVALNKETKNFSVSGAGQP